VRPQAGERLGRYVFRRSQIEGDQDARTNETRLAFAVEGLKSSTIRHAPSSIRNGP
jgi:hypothetical protein